MAEQLSQRLGAYDQTLVFLYPAVLSYDPADPYAVTLTLGPDATGASVRWVFGRDLLADGLRGNTGQGDIRIAYCGGAWVHVVLRGFIDGEPYPPETLLLRHSAVAEFLGASYRLVPAGAERVDVATAVARLLAGEIA